MTKSGCSCDQVEIPADSLIVKGDVYVNEANLTGESHPIGKYRINHHK